MFKNIDIKFAFQVCGGTIYKPERPNDRSNSMSGNKLSDLCFKNKELKIDDVNDCKLGRI